jgi:hypothetical protein
MRDRRTYRTASDRASVAVVSITAGRCWIEQMLTYLRFGKLETPVEKTKDEPG